MHPAARIGGNLDSGQSGAANEAPMFRRANGQTRNPAEAAKTKLVQHSKDRIEAYQFLSTATM
jgi:hypothetical protein